MAVDANEASDSKPSLVAPGAKSISESESEPKSNKGKAIVFVLFRKQKAVHCIRISLLVFVKHNFGIEIHRLIDSSSDCG